MSSPYAAIRSAFVSRLQLYPALPSVAWENVSFTPVAGSSYLKPALLPGEPSQVELGTAGINRHPGVYQISIYVPAGAGLLEINLLRDGLLDHFKRGTIINYMGVAVRVSKVATGPTMQETDWVHVPISIQYYADAAN